jgi:hypothetical protein
MDEVREYWPAVKGGKPWRRFRFGDYQALVLTELESVGFIEYLHVMAVFKVPENKLCLCVAAERNRMHERKLPGEGTSDSAGSHFLGLFLGKVHMNFGSSNDWANIDRFSARALELACDHLKVDAEAVEE